MKITRGNKIRLCLYCLAWLLMAFHPVKRILDFEMPREKPVTMLFEVNLRDPYDPFRGRYVSLYFDPIHVRISDADGRKLALAHLAFDQPCYATVAANADGVGEITGLYASRKDVPAGVPVLTVKYWQQLSFTPDADGKCEHSIQLPFKRFYLNEELAPKAERIMNQRTSSDKVMLKVKIYANGISAATDLLLNGKSISETIKEEAAY